MSNINHSGSLKRNRLPFILVLFLFGIPACLTLPVPSATPTLEGETLVEVTSTPLGNAQQVLTVCLGQEPNSLYPFGELNAAAQTVLATVYNGPINTVGYEYQPVILTKLPSLENGDAEIVTVTVSSGSKVVDANGKITELSTGVKVKPTGCRSEDCIISYDGSGQLEMDQMIVTFRLRPDLVWSDGTPLTSDDSIYAYELQREAGLNSYLIERTQTYEAADAQTVQWFGAPGFIDPTYFTNLWHPAPKHVWSEFPADQLPNIDLSSRTPLGWGPFTIREWNPGESITLEKNPYYYRTRDGFPKLGVVQFRFIPDPDLALSELIAGRCDVIDPSINLEDQVGLLQEMKNAEQVQLFVATGMYMEWIGMGIVPASYDNGYDIRKDRQDFFANKYTRQAIAYCLDRRTIADNVLYGLTDVPASYLPVDHPAYNLNLSSIPYDPEVGISLLEQVGWLDEDEDPSTPRRAINVGDVAYNTPLVLNYQTTSTAQRRQVVAILERSLAQCGIGLNVEFLSANDLYAPGPNGFLFGRNFDLAQYALGVEGIAPPCNWFSSTGIPSDANTWSGANITGFHDDEFDAACLTARSSLPEEASYLSAYHQTQVILAESLPAIPLYSRLRIAATSPNLCGFALDATANILYSVESIGKDETCQN